MYNSSPIGQTDVINRSQMLLLLSIVQNKKKQKQKKNFKETVWFPRQQVRVRSRRDTIELLDIKSCPWTSNHVLRHQIMSLDMKACPHAARRKRKFHSCKGRRIVDTKGPCFKEKLLSRRELIHRIGRTHVFLACK